MEFLVRIAARTGQRPPPDDRGRLAEAERARAGELAVRGLLRRLWRAPGRPANYGIWEAEDATVLHEILASLPMAPWCEFEVIPLAWHPSDPAGRAGRVSSGGPVR